MPGYHHASVVVIGSFNPAIFQPGWFRTHELLPESELDFPEAELPGQGGFQPRAQRFVVSNDAAQIEFESLRLQALQNRWILSTERVDWEADLGRIAHNIFDLLPHTPVRIVGFNVVRHSRTLRPAAEVLADLLPLSGLGAIAGENPAAGATIKAQWNGWRVTLSIEASSKVKDGILLAQNFERDLRGNVNELRPLLNGGWIAAFDRAIAVERQIVEHHRPD